MAIGRIFLFVALPLIIPAAAEEAPSKRAAASWHLLLDDQSIASSQNLVRVLHHPRRHSGNPVLTGTQPWEKWFLEVNGRPVLYDDGSRQFRMYYGANLQDPAAPWKIRYKVCYAVSADGVRWHRVKLHQTAWDGSIQNNILKWGQQWMRRPNIMLDPQDPDRSRRFKMTYVDVISGRPAICKGYSEDGIRWRLNGDGKPWFNDLHNSNLLGWDPRIAGYVLYPRMAGPPNRAGRPRSAIGRSTSPDFVTWSRPEMVLKPGAADGDVDFNGLAATLCGDIYIGLLWIFGRDNLADAELAFSRDGIHWERLFAGEFFFPRGAPEEWDSQGVLPVAPIVRGDRIYFFYSGWNTPYTAQAQRKTQQGWIENGKRKQWAIGLATLRRDGFVSMRAKREAGTLTTKVLRLPRGRLYVNADVRGELRVEILDEQGDPLPAYSAADCRPIRSDRVRQLVRWKNRVSMDVVAGRPARLRFQLRDADLYSFGFE